MKLGYNNLHNSQVATTNTPKISVVKLNGTETFRSKILPQGGFYKLNYINLLLPKPTLAAPIFANNLYVPASDCLATIQVDDGTPQIVLLGKKQARQHDLWAVADAPFLTYAPQEKKTWLNSIEYLYAILPIKMIKLMANCSNGVTEDTITLCTILPTNINCFAFDVSPQKVQAIYNSELESYTIWLEDQNGEQIADSRSYYVEPVHDDIQQFVFRNQLGVWEAHTFCGTATETWKFQHSDFKNTDTITKLNSSAIGNVTIKFTALEQGWAEHLKELMHATACRWLHPNGNWIDIIAQSSDLETINTADWRDNASIEFQYTNIEQ